MAKPVIMPRLGQSVESCIIAQWSKKKGDEIKKGDVLLSYETDKASFDLEAEDEGILLEVFYQDGDEVPVLGNIAVIGQPGEKYDEFVPGAVAAKNSGSPADKEKPEMPVEETADAGESSRFAHTFRDLPDEDPKISPRARKLAEKHGVYYAALKGSGPGGRIIERDIEAALLEHSQLTPTAGEAVRESSLVPPVAGSGLGGRVTDKDLVHELSESDDTEIVKLSNIRKLIAKGMFNSLQNSAQLTHHISADARSLLLLRGEIKKKITEGWLVDNITLNDMVCYAVIKALKKNPYANAHFLGDSIKLFKRVHLGFAVDTERGLIVPVVKNADALSLPELSNKLKDLAEKAKAGSIDPDLISSEAASFTVSNLGAYGIEMFTPVINLPQTAILGVNTIISRPADIGGGVFGFIPYIGLSLTYDHRAIDGGPASVFLGAVKKEIEAFPSSVSQL